MAEMNVTSPAAAFARQAAMEVRVEAALQAALRDFLAEVFALASAQRTALGPASVDERWAAHTSPSALAGRLAPEVAAYVSEGLAESSVPGWAYTSAMAVFAVAADEAWTVAEADDVLREVLSPDSGEAFLTAAAPSPRAQGAARRRAEERRRATIAARVETVRAQAAARQAATPPRTARRGPRHGADWGALDQGGMSWADRMKAEARTAVTGLDGILSTDEMRRQGIPYKMWVTRRDRWVRDAHVAADGQTVPLESAFEVGGYPMMYPGDRSAPAHLTINCRCVTIGSRRRPQGSLALPFLSP